MAETVQDDEAIQLKRREGRRSPGDRRSQDGEATRSVAEQEDGGDSTLASQEDAQTALDVIVTEEKAYSSFTPKEKWGIIVLISMASIFSFVLSTLAQTIADKVKTYLNKHIHPRYPDVGRCFRSLGREDQSDFDGLPALTPSIWGAASDTYGRRPIIIINLVLYILSCIGTALCPTNAFWLLLVLRILQAAGGAATIALGTGVIADISSPHERGKFLGIFQFCGTFSTAIGPVLGGVFAGTLGWRSIFWFLTIFCGVVLVPVVFLLPETLRSLVGDGSISPPLLNCTPQMYIRRRREKRLAKSEGRESKVMDRPERTPFRPLASFVLLFRPDLGMVFLWAAVGYAVWYAVITVFSTLLDDPYGLNAIIIGVCYIPNGVGTGLSALIAGRFMDKAYRKEKKRVGGDHRAHPNEFRLERTRFIFLPYQAGMTIASTLILGWSMEVKANVAVPLVFSFFVGFGTSFLATATIYAIDLYPGQGGAVTATFNLIRCLFGAASVAVIQVLNRHIGAGWSFVLLSGVWIILTPLPIIVAKYGPGWRWSRTEKEEEKHRRNHPTPAISTSAGPPHRVVDAK